MQITGPNIIFLPVNIMSICVMLTVLLSLTGKLMFSTASVNCSISAMSLTLISTSSMYSYSWTASSKQKK